MPMKITRFATAVLAVVLFAVSVPLLAQQEVGGITGIVSDPSGGVLAGAAVIATSRATGIQTQSVTNGNGLYIFPQLQIGEYTITVRAPNFKEFQRTGVRVVSGQRVTIDVSMQVGQVNQTISVSGEAPTLDTTQSVVGLTRTVDEISKLPFVLGGVTPRSAISIAKTLPGVSFDPTIGGAGGQDWTVISRAQINGSMAGNFGYMIDGLESGMGEAESASDVISPLPEMIEEFRLNANADASSGFNGGVSIEMTTRSGTNRLHGSVFEYNRNQALEARNWFATKVAPDHENNGGLAIGGPVWIPKIYDGRNRTFFYTTLDIFRYRSIFQQQVLTVPTPAMKGGDFSQWLGASPIGTDKLGRPIYAGEIYDPATTRPDGSGGFIRDPFMYQGHLNVIDPARLSPASVYMQQFFANPTGPGTQVNWSGVAGPLAFNQDQWTIKIDHQLTSRQKLTFSYETQTRLFFGSSTPGHCGQITDRYTTFGFLLTKMNNGVQDDRCSKRIHLSDTINLTPTMVLSVRAGIVDNGGRVISSVPGTENTGALAGLKGLFSARAPELNIAGFSNLIGSIYGGGLGVSSRKIPATASLGWLKGKHFLKIGAEYMLLPFSLNAQGNPQNTQIAPFGIFQFTQQVTGLPGSGTTGVGYASYLLGEVSSATVGLPFGLKDTTSAWGFYVQDQWRITPKLSINAGLRWNLFVPTTETTDKISSFDPNLTNPATGTKGALALYGNGPGRNGLSSLATMYYKAFAPNLGLAYAPNPRTVIRASYGISYTPYWQKWYGATGPTQPTIGFSSAVVDQTLDNGVTPAYNWNNPFPLTPPAVPVINPSLLNGQNIGYVNRQDNRPPQVQNIAFEIGRELPHSIALKVGYVGTLSHRLPGSGNDLNALPLSDLSLGSLLTANINSPQAVAAGIKVPYPGFNGSVAQALRPYPQYLNINVANSQYGNASYNGLQISAQKHTGDLGFLIAYTLSKEFTNVQYGGSTGFGASFAQSPYLLQQAMEVNNQDRPQVLQLSWVYELPFGRGKRFLGGSQGVVNGILGGWQLSAVQYYMKGFPIRVTSNQTIPGGFGAIWPVAVPGVSRSGVSCGDLNPRDPNSRLLNPAAFKDAPAFTLGNVSSTGPTPRNCPWYDEQVQIDKNVPITEQLHMKFGASIGNLFNRHIWLVPSSNIDVPASFGRVSGASPARSIQIYMRVEF